MIIFRNEGKKKKTGTDLSYMKNGSHTYLKVTPFIFEKKKQILLFCNTTVFTSHDNYRYKINYSQNDRKVTKKNPKDNQRYKKKDLKKFDSIHEFNLKLHLDPKYIFKCWV